MDILNILETCIKLGIPMAVASWLLFSWLYSEGRLDRGADRKTLSANLKQMKKSSKVDQRDNSTLKKIRRSLKKQKDASSDLMQLKSSSQNEDSNKLNYIYDQWMWFGSGFYGLAALWTFVVIETLDVYRFIFSGFGLSKMFEGGLVDLIIAFVVNQIGNIITAFLWFGYWSDDSIIISILVAYLGYMLGIEIAKRNKKVN